MDKDQDASYVQTSPLRNAWLVLWLGIGFSLLATLVIWVTGGFLSDVPHLRDQGAEWYYWKLPAPDFMARLTSWGFYLAHQVAIWGVIFYAQRQTRKYTRGLHSFNLLALGANAFFILLHFIQTHVWYDGLAQDVSIFSSQGSVIVLLIWILLMENNRRGVIMGQRLPIAQRIIHFARKYHGYYFSWAIIYTFWYHPMEATGGHLVGFLYTFLILLQGSLFFTRVHVNRWWMFVQEIIVLAHGTLVAVINGNNMWPMFLFGFGGIFVITQMHGLPLKRWMKWALLALYAGGAALIYSQRGLSRLWELAAIPLIDYLSVVVLALLIGLGLWIYDRVRPGATRSVQAGD